MVSQSQKMQSIDKIFHFITVCRAFFADHFAINTFSISFENNGVIVKILNTEIPAVPKWLQHGLFCKYLCRGKRLEFCFLSKRCAVKSSTESVRRNPYCLVLWFLVY